MKLYFVYQLMLQKVIAYAVKRDFWILLRMFIFPFVLRGENGFDYKVYFYIFLLSIKGLAGFCLCWLTEHFKVYIHPEFLLQNISF